MKKYLLIPFYFTALIVISLTANANPTMFKGHSRSINQESISISGAIERYYETETEYLILISRHAALYSFPKDLSYSDEVKSFINDRIKSKKTVLIKIDPRSAQILVIQDASP